MKNIIWEKVKAGKEYRAETTNGLFVAKLIKIRTNTYQLMLNGGLHERFRASSFANAKKGSELQIAWIASWMRVLLATEEEAEK